MTLEQRLSVLLLTLPVLSSVSAQSATRAEVGSEQQGSPVSFTWVDFDGDSRLDLAAVGANGGLQLLASTGEDRFEDLTERVGLAGISNAALALWADYDSDMRLDLFVGARAGASRLFRNEGGFFTDMSAGSGLLCEGAVQAAHWLDHDGDGRLDLHVVTADQNGLFHGLEGGFFERLELPSIDSPAPCAMRNACSGESDRGTPPFLHSTPRSSTTPGFSPGGPTSGDSSTIAAKASAACAPSLEDQANPGSCLFASTTPTLGRLFPISATLFVAVSGNVGIGTTSPSAKLDVVGTTRIADTLTLSPSGDRALDVSTGSIYKGGALFVHDKGPLNTALGREALASVTTASADTAIGDRALFSNTTGSFNTANGYRALYSNTTGAHNTASGTRALFSNTTGSFNTATGALALRYNTTGNYNAASGRRALYSNTTGARNTAIGFKALEFNTTGYPNTAIGFQALRGNGTGIRNIAIGADAGANVANGDRNIHIGHAGLAGDAFDIRIGTDGQQTRAFIAGVRGITTGSANTVPLAIKSDGQLGTSTSSRRFKEEIRDMGYLTERLLELRPVVFRYKSEVQQGERPLEYGLIAEEVAEVFPELVVYDDDGKPFTVKYHVLDSMLLNELEKLHETVEIEKVLHTRALRELRERFESQTPEMEDLRSELARLSDLMPKGECLDKQKAAADALSE